MNGWINEWRDEYKWMNEWVNEWMDEWIKMNGLMNKGGRRRSEGQGQDHDFSGQRVVRSRTRL